MSDFHLDTYIKIHEDGNKTNKSVEIRTYDIDYVELEKEQHPLYTTIYKTITKRELNECKTIPIVPGLTRFGSDTLTDQKVIDAIHDHGVHPGLIDYYTSREGMVYRCMWTQHEKNHMIMEFDITKRELLDMKNNGFQQLKY